MKDKSLKNKAINIKGKSYVTVAERVLFFGEEYPNGYITTELLSLSTHEQLYVKATVIPDVSQPQRFFTGHAQEVVGDGNLVNKTSALENAETSAVGRALALMGIGVIESIASVDEITKATNREAGGKKASDKQVNYIYELLQGLNTSAEEYEEQIGLKLTNLTSAQASKCIGVLKGRIDAVLAQEAKKVDQKADDFLANAGDPHLGTIR